MTSEEPEGLGERPVVHRHQGGHVGDNEDQMRRRESVQRWWERDNWAQIGTVAAVLVGAGTLLFTGIATLFQAMVADDQLEQSRRTSEQQEREQAALVSYWTSDRESALHIMNRSLDPVHDVELAFAALTKQDATQQPPRGRVTFVVKLGSLPPCSEVVISEQTVGLRWQSAVPRQLRAQHPVRPGLPRGDWRKLNRLQRLELLDMDFVDRDGAGWSRDGDSQLEDGRQGVGYPVGGNVASPGRFVRSPQAEPLDMCREG
ncbi:hypothetical protein [Streptomyces sp. DH-12]|uniref:hypothetical protein n=1 Tax=Streptomyces sp. DH-12 TaxID=2072509 RepID=UPI0010571615|nr:hypothetical protein [Streptomyces sp. DH-12]